MNKQQRIFIAVASGVAALVSLGFSIYFFVAAYRVQQLVDQLGAEEVQRFHDMPNWDLPVALLFLTAGLGYLGYRFLR